MHWVGEVFHRVTVVAGPSRSAQERRIASDLDRQLEVARRGMLDAREIGEYAVAHLANRITFHGCPALEAALAECRNLGNDATAVHSNAVIAAGNPGLTHDTVAETRAAMRTAVFHAVQ